MRTGGASQNALLRVQFSPGREMGAEWHVYFVHHISADDGIRDAVHLSLDLLSHDDRRSPGDYTSDQRDGWDHDYFYGVFGVMWELL
jgi:hypothetical protein